ncbi:hypothetical protein HJC23_007139 [Cyclotella cryptica]|uniref:Uncharacterized protein n=1 Tax=Cyclotella cryptica TaxID=29204 RepID=A0ABD3QPH5_9STRA
MPPLLSRRFVPRSSQIIVNPHALLTDTSTMKSFQILSLFAMVAATMAFAPNKAPQAFIHPHDIYSTFMPVRFTIITHLCPFSLVAQRVVESGFDFKKAAIAAIPAASIATPAFALDSIVEALPTQTLSLEVAFGAYLAVLLGTFLPALFLINLYIQTESRKAGKAGGQDAE